MNLNEQEDIYNTSEEETSLPTQELAPPKKRLKKLHKIIIISVIAFIIVLTLSLSIPLGIAKNRKEAREARNDLYNNLLYMLMNYSENYEWQIKDALDDLPYNYRDTEKLREAYNEITTETSKLSFHISYLSQETADQARKAYSHLRDIDQKYTFVDLSHYIKDVDIRKLIFGKNWLSYSGYNFHWYHDGDNAKWFSTSLDRGQEEGKEYYFAERLDNKLLDQRLIFSYENKNDKNDSYDAFVVRNISYGEGYLIYMNVYSFITKTEYVFF